MKPTKNDLLAQTSRGGRVFLFEYPTNGKGCHMPTLASQDKIENALLDIPGAKSLEGPFVNGILALTIDDDEAGIYTDDEMRGKIAGIISRYWREV